MSTMSPSAIRQKALEAFGVHGITAFQEVIRVATRVKKEIENVESLRGIVDAHFTSGYDHFIFANIIGFLEVLSELLGDDLTKAQEIRELWQFWIEHESYIREVYRMQ